MHVPEFGDKERINILVRESLRSLKTSGRKFWKLLTGVLQKMGFASAMTNNNVWIKLRENGCDVIATRADGFMVAAKDSSVHFNKIKDTFNLRS